MENEQRLTKLNASRPEKGLGTLCDICDKPFNQKPYKVADWLVCSLKCRGEASQREIERKTEAIRAADMVNAASKIVANAWNNPGRAPHIHQAAIEKLKREWPTLAAAVENLAELLK